MVDHYTQEVGWGARRHTTAPDTVLRNAIAPDSVSLVNARTDGLEDDLLDMLRSCNLPVSCNANVIWSRRLRHDTALINAGNGQHWLLKRPGPATLEGPLVLEGERRFYDAIDHFPALAPTAAIVPRRVGVVGDTPHLILQGFPNHMPLRTAVLDGTLSGPSIASELGRALASLHSVADPDCLATFPRAAIPLMVYERCTPEQLAHAPPCFADLLRTLQASPDIAVRLNELRASWDGTSLIHGDMKLDNVLVAPDSTAGPIVVDWELAGLGDPGWDCGSFIGSCLFTWMELLRPGGDASVWRQTMELIISMLRSFWEGYANAREGAERRDNARRHAACGWAGYWLLDRVAATLPIRRRLGALDYTALHVAFRLLLSSPDRDPFASLAPTLDGSNP